MNKVQGLRGRVEAARAVSSCHGAVIFAVFGAFWLLLSSAAFSKLSTSSALPIIAFAVFLVSNALRIRRRGVSAAENAYTEEDVRKNVRTFGIVNAITWTGAFVAANVLANIGQKDLFLVVIVIFVGAHMFFMPPHYRRSTTMVAGACLIVWAIAAALVFHSQAIAAYVALGTGLILWIAGAFSIKSAADSLRSLGP